MFHLGLPGLTWRPEGGVLIQSMQHPRRVHEQQTRAVITLPGSDAFMS